MFHFVGSCFTVNERLFTSGVVVPDNATTNNGTFKCTASNGVGPDATVSFHLSVYGKSLISKPEYA